jgi:hypothetical protein
MQRLIESGKVYENAIKELAKTTGMSEQALLEAFKKAGVKSMHFDDSIYKAAGLNPLPLNLSPAMIQVLAAGLAKTNGVIKNLTMTTAMSAQQSFIASADLAYLQVSSGAMSYDQAIRVAVKDVANKGLSTIDYATGHRDQLDVAMRRTVLTGVSQTTGKLQEARADEVGCDLVQVSAHIGARPSHQVWQGKIFSRSGTSKRYPPFILSTGYGTGPGLGGWNCRHSFYPFFEGISENAYNALEVESYAKKTIEHNGQQMPIYDLTQAQRAIERKIRFYKRQASALEAAGLSNEGELAKVTQYQARMRNFIEQMNKQKEFTWYRQRVREQIYPSGKIKKISVPKLTPEPVLPVSPPKVVPEPEKIPRSMRSRLNTAEMAGVPAKVSDGVKEAKKLRNLFVEAAGKDPALMSLQDKGAIKDTLISEISKRSKVPYEQVNDFVRQWAVSSNDSDYRSLFIQKRAAEKFGVPLTKFQKELTEGIEKQREKALPGKYLTNPTRKLFETETGETIEAIIKSGFKSPDEAIDAILDGMYAHTQDYLAKNGITKLELMRGVDLSKYSAVGRLIETSLPIETNALSSWTINLQTAQGFASGTDWEVYRMTIPAERIFSTAITGNGCFSEWEVVVLGNNFDEALIILKKGQ